MLLFAIPACATGEQSGPPASQPAASQPASVNPAAAGFDEAGSDSRAIAIADTVMERLGGRDAWDATRHVSWSFFGSRRHVWDRFTGDVRIEGTDRESGRPYVILMNVKSREGRAWLDGEAVDDADLSSWMDRGRRGWINDSYWLVMPYKLKDSGVTLGYVGAQPLPDGREADVLQLTFREVGVTPQNKYHVFVARDTGLVEQWSFFRDAADEAPSMTTPWKGWTRHGRIMLCGDRGERGGRPMQLSEIAVFDELPRSVYTSPEPAKLPARP
jgi:hypothetical protein